MKSPNEVHSTNGFSFHLLETVSCFNWRAAALYGIENPEIFISAAIGNFASPSSSDKIPISAPKCT